MKILAEYVMAGPKQASLLCFGMGFVPVFGPWLSSAAVVLVVLHLGLGQAVKILPWAVLPTLAWVAMGDPSNLMLLLTVIAGAVVLENSRSLSTALIVVSLVSVLAFLMMQITFPNSLEPLNKVMNEALSASPDMKQLANSESDTVEQQTGEMVNEERQQKLKDMIALLTHMAFAWAGGMTACLILLLGRWWQSLLYKPGAFQQEFHMLKLNLNQALVLCGAMIISSQLFNGLDFANNMLAQGKMGMVLAPVFSVPLLLSGIALVHGVVAIFGASIHWLGMFYVSMLFMGHLLVMPLMVTALVDAVVDFRARVKKSRTRS